MKKEKIEQMRNRQKEKKAGEKIRTLSIVNLFVLGTGFILVMLDMHPVMTRVGNGLVIVGTVLVIFTIVYMVKMRQERKKQN
jgi:hypothetical protein